MPLPEKPSFESSPTVALIARLGENDPSVRDRAAREIFALGFARASRIARDWLRDAQIAGSFLFEALPDGTRAPRTTVGIAVQPDTFDRIRTAHGGPRLADVPPDLDAKEFEIYAGAAVRLDVLTTREPGGDGAMARFLRKRGEGIQQVEMDVRSVARSCELITRRFGLAPIYSEARPGADGTRVNFFLVPDPQGGKLLIELVETPGAET
jgi:hypothetical protein